MNIGVVLSGGFAKGAYQIGALKAIAEFIPRHEIKYVSGASVGALNGYALVTQKLNQAEKMWRSFCRDNDKIFAGKILRSKLLQEDIATIYSPDDILTAKMYCPLFDITHKRITYKDLQAVEKSKIPDYLKACVAIPIYNHSVEIDKISYYDGAMIDNIPVFPLLKQRLDYMICIYFDNISYKFENTYFDNKIIKISFPCENILKQSLIFSKNNIDNMVKAGFARTTDILNSVLHHGYQDLDYIYRAISCKNLNEIRSLRITGDVLVTKINAISQKFIKKEIKM